MYFQEVLIQWSFASGNVTQLHVVYTSDMKHKYMKSIYLSGDAVTFGICGL